MRSPVLCIMCASHVLLQRLCNLPGKLLQSPAVITGIPGIISCCEAARPAVQPPCRTLSWGWPEGPEPAGVFVYPAPYGRAAPCGSDWATPCAALSNGIAQAATSSATQIWVGPGAALGPGLGLNQPPYQAVVALL